jgi:ADP-ribose pyrophosphatase
MQRQHSPWLVKSRTRVFAGGPIEEVAVEHVALPDGREIADYYRIVLPDYALVFALTADERVLLLRQYKHGIGRVCVAFPGGALQRGEEPRAAAERELREETGYEGGSWRSLGSYVTNANQRCNVAHLFVAAGCRRTGDPTAPDVEMPELLRPRMDDLWSVVRPGDLAGAAHVALFALATHPMIRGRTADAD